MVLMFFSHLFLSSELICEYPWQNSFNVFDFVRILTKKKAARSATVSRPKIFPEFSLIVIFRSSDLFKLLLGFGNFHYQRFLVFL